jgi:hypothetical protein
VEKSSEGEIENLVMYLRIHGAKTVHNLLTAFLIWLFGNLVFIPLANSLNWQTGILCSLIFFTAFTILLLRALPNLKKLVDAFSVFPARKYSIRKGLRYENSLVLFRHILYIIVAVILYLLYLPFLTNFHPSISGIVLILVLVWIFFLSTRIFSILFPKFLEWLVQK